MQELEKILEEIDAHAIEFEAFGISDDYISVGWVKEIIRKHMNEDNDIVEQCPHCENELALHWNVEKDGYEVYCPYCGFPVMLCSMCDARDGKVCDRSENVGCKHSSERYRDYFGKHMNDGWIPCSERLPEEKKSVLVQWEKYDRHLGVTLTYLDVMWLDDKEEQIFETINGVPNGKVIAWRHLPEPYKPPVESADGKRMREREAFFAENDFLTKRFMEVK